MALDLNLFVDEPERVIEHPLNDQFTVPLDEVRDFQLAAAAGRFKDLVDKVPMLASLAEEQGLSAINAIEDLAPLLVIHSAYKSYPLSYLENGRFDRLTRWLDGFTAHDLSGLDASACESVDDWVGVLNTQSPIRVLHSSGTSGKLSFIPRSEAEVLHSAHGHRRMLEAFGDEAPALGVPPEESHLIVPGYRHGAAALQRYVEAISRQILKDESRVVALNPGYFSADLLSIGGRMEAAEAKGELGWSQLSPAVLKRREAFIADQKDGPRRMDEFLDRLESLRGQPVWFIGSTAPALFQLTQAGEARGISNLFRADSFATGGGGSKGRVLPDDWDVRVKAFLGIPELKPAYGMSELTIMTRICPNGRYHLPPWWIPFLLDPKTGEQPPRTGLRTGRFGAFDLNARTYWGGFLTGDEVTLNWGDVEPCGCGRVGPFVHKEIRRYSQAEGGDDKITCAGAPTAHDNALAFLLDGIN